MPYSPRPIAPRIAAAFTLVELLVVIGIITLVIGILLPCFCVARRAAQATRCASNLRQIGMAVRLYAQSNQDALQTTNGLVGSGPHWIEVSQPPGFPSALRLADASTSKTAYWGAAYLPMIASRSLVESEGLAANHIVDVASGIWYCPSSNGMSLQYGVEPTYPISYGLNGFLVGVSGTSTNGKPVLFRKLSSYPCPAEVIVAHDAAVTLIAPGSYASSNTLSSWTGSQPSNLRDWRPPNGFAIQAGFTADGTREFYRHSRRCQVLFVDGHVGAIAESLGFDVPQRWYTGKPG